MMRRIGKQILTLTALLALLLPVPAAAEPLITTIVVDPLSGVALEGYDPVTYFTEPQPLQGYPDFEYYWAGVPWYFVSAANRDIFMRAPDVYAPQHGGYCEMSLARGYLSDGKPNIFIIDHMKLYLFYSAANREAFLLAKDQARTNATSNWAVLSRELTGPPPEPGISIVPAATAEPTSIEPNH